MGISDAEIRILRALTLPRQAGDITRNETSRYGFLKRAVAAGLVAKEKDGRTVRYRLRPAGRAFLAKVGMLTDGVRRD